MYQAKSSFGVFISLLSLGKSTLPAGRLVEPTAIVIEINPQHIILRSRGSLLVSILSHHKTRQGAIHESFQTIVIFTQGVIQSGDELRHERNHKPLPTQTHELHEYVKGISANRNRRQKLLGRKEK